MPSRHQLADTVVNGFSTDPLQVLQAESLTTRDNPLAGITPARPSAPLSDPAINGGINTPFIDLPSMYADPHDNEEGISPADAAQRHLAVTPLLRGLGGSLAVHNTQDADDFLEEAGRTLQAAIQGLLELQQRRNSLSDKHLRPLEDNPLRLNMDYATALDVLFAEGKSPVHLAAPAAVSESLRNIRHHEEANRAAIVESLRVLLDAFSPQSLMRRFVQYVIPHVGKQAVIFDADGLLFEQQDADILHRRLWIHMLDWLAQKRARQPLNGLILTLDLPDLLTADKPRREHLLQILRGRLQDIRQHLHCQLPVYVVLTRLDLLHGFAALFQSLDRNDRDAILGVTFTRHAHENDDWRTELNAFWQTWGELLNNALPERMLPPRLPQFPVQLCPPDPGGGASR